MVPHVKNKQKKKNKNKMALRVLSQGLVQYLAQ